MISRLLVIAAVSSELVLVTLSILMVLAALLGAQLSGGPEFIALSQSLRTNVTSILLVALLIFNLHACYAATISIGATNAKSIILNLGLLG